MWPLLTMYSLSLKFLHPRKDLLLKSLKKKKNPTRKTFLPQSMVLKLLSSFAHLILMSWHCMNANDDWQNPFFFWMYSSKFWLTRKSTKKAVISGTGMKYLLHLQEGEGDRAQEQRIAQWGQACASPDPALSQREEHLLSWEANYTRRRKKYL